MELNTLNLLRLTPTEALMVIGNESLGLSMSPSNCVVENILGMGGRLTEVTVKAQYDGSRPINSDAVANPYEGSVTFIMNRLDLGDVFGNVFVVKSNRYTTIGNLLMAITNKTGIVFDEHDFENTTVDSTSVVLTAKPESRRWVGEVTITLNEGE